MSRQYQSLQDYIWGTQLVDQDLQHPLLDVNTSDDNEQLYGNANEDSLTELERQ